MMGVSAVELGGAKPFSVIDVASMYSVTAVVMWEIPAVSKNRLSTTAIVWRRNVATRPELRLSHLSTAHDNPFPRSPNTHMVPKKMT